ncbi:hypothetical protein Tco_0899397 [Tanacetum coccineum]
MNNQRTLSGDLLKPTHPYRWLGGGEVVVSCDDDDEGGGVGVDGDDVDVVVVWWQQQWCWLRSVEAAAVKGWQRR